MREPRYEISGPYRDYFIINRYEVEEAYDRTLMEAFTKLASVPFYAPNPKPCSFCGDYCSDTEERDDA